MKSEGLALLSGADKLGDTERQVHARLKALSTRIVSLKAEKQRLAQTLIIHLIEEHHGPLRLASLQEDLARNGYPLNPHTFRSHIRFLAAAGLITRCGPRGSSAVIASTRSDHPG